MRLFLQCLLFICIGTMLAGCSPKYNWREVHGDKLPFTVLMPDKPSVMSRRIDLNGTTVEMTMTAAEIDGITFAVGTVQMADAAQTPAALQAMRSALLHNINGKLQAESIPGQQHVDANILELVAEGNAGGRQLQLMARLQARDRRLYQVLIVGPRSQMKSENNVLFFTSFKPD